MGPRIKPVALVISMEYIRKMRFLLSAALAVLFLAAFVTMSGCGGKPVNENDPASLYADAEEDIKTDHYAIAIEKLRTVKNKFPYSRYATDAQLKIADIYFMQESYAEAALAYETFRDLHPKHEKTPYAMYRVAKSHYMDAPENVARDMTPAQKALDAYQAFLRTYPAATETEEAKKDVAEVRRRLAAKELYIANFYWREEQYKAAKARYLRVVDTFGDTQPAQDAKERLFRIEDRIKIQEKREEKERIEKERERERRKS